MDCPVIVDVVLVEEAPAIYWPVVVQGTPASGINLTRNAVSNLTLYKNQ